jgi:alkaline phosphatase D
MLPLTSRWSCACFCMHRMRRREFLKITVVGLAGACTATPGVPGTSVDAGLTPDSDVPPSDAAPPPMTRDLGAIPASTRFGLGVMAGDATSDRALLWTKYTGTAMLAIYVQRMGGPAAAEVMVTPEPGGFVHIDVAGLTAGARYEYAFLEVDGGGNVVARSAIGSFRAALADQALEKVVFAGVSCTSQFLDATNANLGRLATRTDLDFVIHAGDQLYTDSPAGSPAMDLAGYRAKYAEAWARTGLAGVHAQFGMYNTLDDHEVYNDWGGYRDDPRIMAGVQSFYDHQPIRVDPAKPHTCWRSFKWGRTLELFVLDCRSERDPSTGRYLSDAQHAWLLAGLQASQAVFKFIVSSCPIGIFPSTINTWRSPTDRWANPAYAAQRTALLDVAQEVGGVWFLSGDFHFATVGRVQYPDTTRYTRVREVLMGPGGQAIGGTTAIPNATRVAQVQALDNTNTHWTFATPKNNYVVIRVNPVADATHAVPWLDIAYYDATTKLFGAPFQLL